MRTGRMLKSLGAILPLFCLVAVAAADVRLPAVFSDHMVLQREAPVPVWGWANPGEKVTVAIGDVSGHGVGAALVMAARALYLQGGWMLDKGIRCTTEAALAKCFASDAAMKVTTDAVQILAGSGYMKGAMVVYGIPALALVLGAVFGKEVMPRFFRGTDPDILSALCGFGLLVFSFFAVKFAETGLSNWGATKGALLVEGAVGLRRTWFMLVGGGRGLR